MNNDHVLPNCLLVDDLEENLIALKALLKDEKVNVYTAQSGNEALELLLKHDFALSLIDVQMPNMDGFELAEIMRSTERTRQIPIIFVTAAGSNAQRVFRGYEAGAVDFLHKPLASQIVLGKVRVFLELFNHKQELEDKISKLRETESYLQSALKSRDEFMSICSHELKTPLTTLKMQLQILERVRERQGDEKAFSVSNMERFLQQADRSVERIIHLVNDMLDISRVNTGRLSLMLEKVNLQELITEVIERLTPIMNMANCLVSFRSTLTTDCHLDKFRIEQVITNLLTNAAKYAPDRPVEITLDKVEGKARISVTDHGPGITLEDQKRIFERFERAVSHNSVSGLGLGLYISRQIVEMHEGSITVNSEINKGTTFTVDLPCH